MVSRILVCVLRLVGTILWVTWPTIISVAIVYAILGAVLFTLSVPPAAC
jgi:hypothetical protein